MNLLIKILGECLLVAGSSILLVNMQDKPGFRKLAEEKIFKIQKTADFEVTGDGTDKNWKRVEWLILPQRKAGGDIQTAMVKILYSENGIYFLFNCKDKKLSATMNADFMDLWKEDVVEVFLWPDQDSDSYFEYEISPLNCELPILISNQNGDIVRWQPFHYDKDRRVRHATNIKTEPSITNAAITEWSAEFFIPYKLLRPLDNITPHKGTIWRANLYRVDYDTAESVWSWQPTIKSFHEFKRFGIFLFD